MTGTDENYQEQQKLVAEYSDSGGHSSIEGGVCNYSSCPLRDEDYAGFVEWVSKERLMDRFVHTADEKERRAII